MRVDGLTLLVPGKVDAERDAVSWEWEQAGGVVIRLDRFWEPPRLEQSEVRVYGSDSFCLVLQQKLGLDLVSPADDLILAVPEALSLRSLTCTTLGETPALPYPAFLKPLTPKQFTARVYSSGEDIARECAGLPPETRILVSEVVHFAAEARCFARDGVVLDCAVYEGTGDPADAAACARDVLASVACPPALVVDVGLIPERGWAVVEFNAAWGAGLNGCDPARVLPAIARASAGRVGQQPDGAGA